MLIDDFVPEAKSSRRPIIVLFQHLICVAHMRPSIILLLRSIIPARVELY
jgi:hypothetical protein